MGLYALVLILIEKCFKGRKNAYTVMGLACLALSLMTWGLDLAYALGFSSSNYFSSVFKKINSCTSKDYRKHYLKNHGLH